MWGFIGDNHLDEIETCLKDAGDVLSDVEKVVKDVSDGSWTTAASDVKDTAALIPKMFGSKGDCTNMLKDIEAIEKWADRSYWRWAEQVAKDMLFHRSEIEKDAIAIGKDWNAGEYYESGKALADLLTVSLGPIETSSSQIE